MGRYWLNDLYGDFNKNPRRKTAGDQDSIEILAKTDVGDRSPTEPEKERRSRMTGNPREGSYKR
jgi:hypothetical protein